MADDNKELMELLDKLKKMEPDADFKKAGKPQKPSTKSVSAPTENLLPRAADRKPEKPAILTTDIYKKIADIERDIRTKEEGINLDLEKLDALVEAIGQREQELSERESTVFEKDRELSRRIEDIRKIKKELQAVLR